MKVRPAFSRFIPVAGVALPLVILPLIAFAQSPDVIAQKMAIDNRTQAEFDKAQQVIKDMVDAQAKQKADTATASYEIEIKNGLLVWNGTKRQHNASELPANLPYVIDLLRVQHPEDNFVLSPAVVDVQVPDLKLRNANVNEKLEAIRIASGKQFVFNETKLTEGHSLFVISELPARADAKLQVEAFNVGGYLDSLGSSENKDERQRLIAEHLAGIESMVRETVDQYRKISADLNRPGSTPLPCAASGGGDARGA